MLGDILEKLNVFLITTIMQSMLFIVIVKDFIKMKLPKFCLRVIQTEMVSWNLYSICCYVRTLGGWEEWIFWGETEVTSWWEAWGDYEESRWPVRTPCGCVWFGRDTIAKYYKLGNFKQQNCLTVQEARSPKSRYWYQSETCRESFFLASFQLLISLIILSVPWLAATSLQFLPLLPMAFFLLCLNRHKVFFSPFKNTCHIGLGTTLMT